LFYKYTEGIWFPQEKSYLFFNKAGWSTHSKRHKWPALYPPIVIEYVRAKVQQKYETKK